MDHAKFIDLLTRARIIETRTGIKGSIAYPPLGMKLRNQVIKYWREFVENLGYSEVLFPILIPEKNFDEFNKIFPVKEKMFFTESRGRKFFLKPTGECEIYPIVKEWLREYNDAPIKVYQIGSQLRPHKDTSIMLNGDEQLTLMEAHSFHSSEEEALKEYGEIIKRAKIFSANYGLPFLEEHRCDWKNKDFYEKECSMGTWIFSKDRSFCNAVIYHQGNNFSKLFDIKCNGNHVFQNTFGVNVERILSSVLSIYCEEDQVVIPPHLYPDAFITDKSPLEVSKRFGYPLVIGKKYAYRIDTKKRIPASEALDNKEKILSEIKNNLEKKAQKRFESVIVKIGSKEEINKIVNEKKMAEFDWCGCLKAKDYEKNIPGEYVGYIFSPKKGKCVFCNKESDKCLLAAKRTSSP